MNIGNGKTLLCNGTSDYEGHISLHILVVKSLVLIRRLDEFLVILDSSVW
jgi:hypothetical protein